MNLTRNIIALIITIIILPICSSCFLLTSNINFDYSEINNEIALYDLRRIMLLAYDVTVSSYNINFRYHNDNYNLTVSDNRLILTPGYQMFLNDIDNVFFEQKDGCIYVVYDRKNREYERIIASAQRFYIDEFSSCDELDSFDSDDQS